VVPLVLGACDPGAPQGDAPGSAPQPLLTERPRFDGNAALQLVRTQVDFGPRVPGTEGHAAQLAWMLDLLRAHADTVTVDAFTHTATDGRVLELTNVMASFRPESEHRILVLAHWDTRPTSDQAPDPADRDTPVPGANDGASGTAVLLELARMMATQPPGTGVDLLFVDGEDYGPDNAWCHTPEDTPDKLSARTLGMVGEVVAELLYQGG
jgi:hypothetical protein